MGSMCSTGECGSCEMFRESDAEDRDALIHPPCLQCHQETCALDDDGAPHCAHDCEADFGHPVYDDQRDVVGYLHKDCQQKFLLAGLVQEIEETFKVRAPLGLEPWIAERARNLATRLTFSFNIQLLNKE